MRGSFGLIIIFAMVIGPAIALLASLDNTKVIYERKKEPDFTVKELESALVLDFDGQYWIEKDTIRIAPLPKEVAERIHETVRDEYLDYTNIEEFQGRYMPMKAFYGPVFYMPAFDDVALYIFKVYSFGCISPVDCRYYFVLFHPETKKVTREHFSISGKWIGGAVKSGLFCQPAIHFFDINQDGKDELVIEEAVHNGTMYNATIYHYFHIDEEMNLSRMCALESRVIDLYSNEDGFIIRRISRLKQNEIKIDVTLQIPRGAPTEENIGYIILRSKDNSSPFQVARKHVDLEKYHTVLVTASGVDDGYFIKEGYKRP